VSIWAIIVTESDVSSNSLNINDVFLADLRAHRPFSLSAGMRVRQCSAFVGSLRIVDDYFIWKIHSFMYSTKTLENKQVLYEN